MVANGQRLPAQKLQAAAGCEKHNELAGTIKTRIGVDPFPAGRNRGTRKDADATERALALDPNLAEAEVGLILLQTDRGDNDGAYVHARDLLTRRPHSARAHFALSYVLRHVGRLEDSTQECDRALAEDPHNRTLRSCGIAFLRVGNPERAVHFYRLDAGTNWARRYEAGALFRQKRFGDAAALYADAGQPEIARLIRGDESRPIRDGLAAQLETDATADFDPESAYDTAVVLSATGYPQAALRLLRRAVDKSYLCHGAMEGDPAFDAIRRDVEYGRIRADAARKQADFEIRQKL